MRDFDLRRPLLDSYGCLDEEVAAQYCEHLRECFCTSREFHEAAVRAEDAIFVDALVRFALIYCDAHPTDIRPHDLEDVLLNIFPRKLDVDAERAVRVVHTLRTFWIFMQREFNVSGASRNVAYLDNNAVEALRARLQARPCAIGDGDEPQISANRRD